MYNLNKRIPDDIDTAIMMRHLVECCKFLLLSSDSTYPQNRNPTVTPQAV